ncbi:hypothetical protein BD779DRAFT_1435077 [Infundibulicybe gibba]|nr:hypothetical protein BD779DRAFT_1435077 [Infundibulicybe gibba]
MADIDVPPSYDFTECHSSPAYSACAGVTEIVLNSEHLGPTGCPTCDWVFETKHMKINLGPRLWRLSSPSYGLDGIIKGAISLTGDSDRVERISVTLEGHSRTTSFQRGGFATDSVVTIMSQTLDLYDSSINDHFDCDDPHNFSMPIPSHVQIHGRDTPTPPSWYSHHQHATCDVSYCLKFSFTRKGKSPWKTESKTIPIIYLPKSRPTQPPLSTIPRPSRIHDFEDASSFLHLFDRVKTVPLEPYPPSGCKDKTTPWNLDAFSKAVHLSIPSPLCFTSGELIPFTLSLVFPNEPVLAKLLTRGTRIHLLKRVSLWRKGHTDPVHTDELISSAQLRYQKEYMEGITLLRGVIQAGTEGRENSWKIDDVAEVQYILRVNVLPSRGLLSHIPSFRHDQPLQLTTDYWGSLERELSATGGMPTPALGLTGDLRHTQY